MGSAGRGRGGRARKTTSVITIGFDCTVFEHATMEFHGFYIASELLSQNGFIHSPLGFYGASILLLAQVCNSQYMVDVVETTYGGCRLVYSCQARGANFGATVPSFGRLSEKIGCISFTDSQDACSSVAKPKRNVSGCRYYYAAVPRGVCPFSVKAYQVQLAQYAGLVVYSRPNEWTISMDGSMHQDLVNIPVLMVTYSCMERIIKMYPSNKGFKIILRGIPGYYTFTKFGIPFFGVVILCVVFLLVSMVVRVYREHQYSARKHLSKKKLRKLPTRKCQKDDAQLTCAICLDDFAEGETLRILPCNHTYHSKCIDRWLTTNQSVCPLCKRKICFIRGHCLPVSNDSRGTDGIVSGISGTPTNRFANNDDLEASLVVRRSPHRSSGIYLVTSSEIERNSDVALPRNTSSLSTLLRQKLSPVMQFLKDGTTKNSNGDTKISDDFSQLDTADLTTCTNSSSNNEILSTYLDDRYQVLI